MLAERFFTIGKRYFAKKLLKCLVDCEKSSNFARMNLQMFRYITLSVVLMAALTLLSACSNSDDAPATAAPAETAPQEVLFNANVWRMMQGSPRRATTYDNQAALQAAGFKCYAYVDGSATQYISGSTVSYADSQWSFDDGKHYWPMSGALNFFAHLPATLPSYYSFDPAAYADPGNLDGYSEDTPRIVCTSLPVSLTAGETETKELIVAYAAEQDKAGTNSTLQPTAGQVALTFKRPMARVYFRLSAASGTNVTINSVTIAGIKNNGTCVFNGAANPQTTVWTPSGDATNLVVTGSPATGDTPYLVMPQSFAANLTFTVNATWDDWSDETKDVSASVAVGSWSPGYSYTYTFTLSKYALTVNSEKYTEQW